MSDMRIGFNRPTLAGNELEYIRQSLERAHLSGDGAFTKRCHAWLERRLGAPQALLTHSCTAALEMAALLTDVGPGDEVIMPSFTFVSTANAFVLRGAVPVFVDIRPDTLNIDERLIEAAITPRTRAICVVHYAGVACDMDVIGAIAARHGLAVIEDAAQALMAAYRGRPLGTFGALSAFSFHETKNLISGEGGALVVNDPDLITRAEIIREKGTNRSRFLRGEVNKYTWVDVGSSYLPSDLLAAFLLAQFENAERLDAERHALWNAYHEALAPLEDRGLLRRPLIPAECRHNAHLYYVLARTAGERDALIAHLRTKGIQAPFHYVPLHSAPAGRRYARAMGALSVTTDLSARLLRLPMWYGLGAGAGQVVEAVQEFFRTAEARAAATTGHAASRALARHLARVRSASGEVFQAPPATPPETPHEAPPA
ncbi:dTDP-4-amino-4,6-dideoxygalactose transaminase [Azospirillum brasilense]|uniref:dTDP-4-amino-4,6-dideoxygalactose transaminase n=1 Tax=Azospirillum brasilense TaxID=192 RepID=A0A560CL95_AZOBR|nr:dTDP-4-amino-4,6-dideoxygalactose transaminase [Azospirillum brasilense]TWA85628.1 dTDP-4-amino-4,6-dideoxygalactose transaminase [Azospirillum brasilense]